MYFNFVSAVLTMMLGLEIFRVIRDLAPRDQVIKIDCVDRDLASRGQMIKIDRIDKSIEKSVIDSVDLSTCYE